MSLPRTSTAVLLVLCCCFCASLCGAMPTFSWDKLSLFAHCGSNSSVLSNATAKYFSGLGFVTLEKTMALSTPPAYHGAEAKIIAAAKLIKSFNSSATVLTYFQNDWARTWYDSGVWFESRPDLELHDRHGNLVVSPYSEHNHTWHAYDFSLPEVQAVWVNVSKVCVDAGACDGVFVDGYRWQIQRFEVLVNCTLEKQTQWIRGMNQATAVLAASLKKQDKLFFVNPWAAAPPQTVGVMLENFGWDLLGDIELLRREVKMHRYVAAHVYNFSNYETTLAGFLLGTGPNAYLGTGFDWENCDEWAVDRPEYSKPLGAPLAEADFHVGLGTIVATRAFASGTKVRATFTLNVRKLYTIKSCIWWADGTTTGNDCASQ